MEIVIQDCQKGSASEDVIPVNEMSFFLKILYPRVNMRKDFNISEFKNIV